MSSNYTSNTSLSYLQVTLLTSRLRHDDVVIDVGANIGAITVPLAKAVPDGLVISFEPQRITNQILGANAQLNSLSNVVVKRAGAGAVPGSIPVRYVHGLLHPHQPLYHTLPNLAPHILRVRVRCRGHVPMRGSRSACIQSILMKLREPCP
jgi:hypothetical protein